MDGAIEKGEEASCIARSENVLREGLIDGARAFQRGDLQGVAKTRVSTCDWIQKKAYKVSLKICGGDGQN